LTLQKPNSTRFIKIREVNSSLVFPIPERFGSQKPNGEPENLVTQV